MPQLYCQYYPSFLEDLTSIEEAVIAKAHPVVTILKLRPNNSFNPGIYRDVCGHFVFLSQNTKPLFILLPSEITFVDDVVQVMWVGKMLLQPKQLSGFMSIRKHCVIGALQWLMANNLLYEYIQIYHRLLKTWEDKFIPSGIIDSIVYCNANQYKREGYTTDFNDSNFKNDLDATIVGTGIKEDHINTGCVYSNIDN